MSFTPTPQQQAAIDHHIKLLDKLVRKLEGKDAMDIQGLLIMYKVLISHGRGNILLHHAKKLMAMTEGELDAWMQMEFLVDWTTEEENTQ